MHKHDQLLHECDELLHEALKEIVQLRDQLQRLTTQQNIETITTMDAEKADAEGTQRREPTDTKLLREEQAAADKHIIDAKDESITQPQKDLDRAPVIIKDLEKSLADRSDELQKAKKRITELEMQTDELKAQARSIVEKILDSRAKKEQEMEDKIAALKDLLLPAQRKVRDLERVHLHGRTSTELKGSEARYNHLKAELAGNNPAQLILSRDVAKAALKNSQARTTELEATVEHLEDQMQNMFDAEDARLVAENQSDEVVQLKATLHETRVVLDKNRKHDAALQEQLNLHFALVKDTALKSDERGARDLARLNDQLEQARHDIRDLEDEGKTSGDYHHFLTRRAQDLSRLVSEQQRQPSLQWLVQMVSDFESQASARAQPFDPPFNHMQVREQAQDATPPRANHGEMNEANTPSHPSH